MHDSDWAELGPQESAAVVAQAVLDLLQTHPEELGLRKRDFLSAFARDDALYVLPQPQSVGNSR